MNNKNEWNIIDGKIIEINLLRLYLMPQNWFKNIRTFSSNSYRKANFFSNKKERKKNYERANKSLTKK